MSNNNNNPDNKAPNPGTKDALKAENDALKAKLEAMRAQAEKDAAEKAELEALRAQAEKDAAEKAELEALIAKAAVKQAEPEQPTVHAEEREEIYVPKGYANDEPNLLISVNGVNYLLPKGKYSNVPKFIAEEFHRSRKAQEALDIHVDKMLEKASK